jgi:hypothetical protein
MVKNRHKNVNDTISFFSIKLENINVNPPSATPVAPGVGAKYVTKVNTICIEII